VVDEKRIEGVRSGGYRRGGLEKEMTGLETGYSRTGEGGVVGGRDEIPDRGLEKGRTRLETGLRGRGVGDTGGRESGMGRTGLETVLSLGLYTTLPSPIVYSVRHKRRGRCGGGVCCAMVVQYYCKRVGFVGGGGQYTDD